MAAQCYHCQTGTQPIPGQKTGDPLGVCLKCHVTACRGHAARDPNYPRWVCVVCDTSLLAASAVGAGGSTSVLAQLISSALLRDEGLFPNLNAFLNARPEMRWVLEDVERTVQEGDSHFRQGAIATMWQSLTPEARRMIAAAIVIVRRLRINTWELVEGLRILIEELGDEH